jgi:serine/threonine-protein kinase
MGVVFAATNQSSQKRVALKWMLPGLVEREGAVERFVREARNAGTIDDPHVVNVFDVVEDGPTFFLVMELLRGEPLSRLMKRPDIALSELLRISIGAARGVAAAHAKNIIHRDLKPDNIFVCEYPGLPRSAKVLDFGISKFVDPSLTSVTGGLTADGTALGTPYYMSPEQARGQRDIDQRADIYSFGVILFEMCAGRVPFDADGYNALLAKILTEPAPSLCSLRPELPQELELIVARAMAQRREERYSRIDELCEALERLLSGPAFERTLSRAWTESTLAAPAPSTAGALVSSGRLAGERARSKRAVVLSAVLGATGLSVIGAFAWSSARDDAPPPSANPLASSLHAASPAEPGTRGAPSFARGPARVARHGSRRGVGGDERHQVGSPRRHPDRLRGAEARRAGAEFTRAGIAPLSERRRASGRLLIGRSPHCRSGSS